MRTDYRSEADFVITVPGDQTTEITGKATVSIDTVTSADYTYGDFAGYVAQDKTVITLNPVGEYQMKITSNKSPIVRTARVLGWEDPEGAVRREPTIALIKAAAKRAGVGENTEYTIIQERGLEDFSLKNYVEFRWEDWVN